MRALESGPGSSPASEASSWPAIEILADHVVDQIAAGEVIERPASVVKELVENALDAGASHITVEVEGGGKRLIRVLDNGRGMRPEEARLALRRHATSKVRVLDDLIGLRTMGFRGEALPSIAAVSRMSIITRCGGSLAGRQLEVEAGKVIDERDIGAPVGTRIEVRDLLFCVPARLKFLKGDATESSHITDVVTRLALAHPRVHFRLRHGARNTVDAPMHGDEFERARALLGSRLGRRLHPVADAERGVQVTAYLAAPELATSTSRGLQLFVGKRPVRDRGLLHAIKMGYGELLPRGRYPVAVLFVDAPPGSVDVNVHPQKSEVRFADPQSVYAAVRHTVARGVGSAPWLAEDPPEVSPVRMRAVAEVAPRPLTPANRASEMATRYAAAQTRSLFAPRLAAPRVSVRDEPPAVAPAPEAFAPPRLEGGFFSRLRYLGQLDRTYLVCEAVGEMVLIDQHAAHERVEFQRLRERYQQHSVPVQRLLFPETVQLGEAQLAAAAEWAESLAPVGFEVEPFGGDTLAIKAVPSGIRSGAAAEVLGELLEQLSSSGGSRAVEERLDAVFATIACHSVVRAGDSLGEAEVEALLSSMDAVDYRAHCPHGRPVLLRISIAEIARRFGRT